MAIYADGAVSKPSQRRDGNLRSSRTRAVLFTLVAVAAGLGSALMVMRYIEHHSGSGASVAVSRVVVAASEIPVGTSLTRDMIKVVDWPTSAEPQGSFTTLDELGGRVASTALVAGEAVVESRLSPKGSGAGMASLIPPNMRAMTVPVNDIIGVSGFIHPGDLVDVITTMQAPPATGPNSYQQQEYRSKIVLQDIRVLAVGQRLVSDSNKPEAVPSVTLLVSPEQSERLALASTQGKLQLTMRSQLDKEQFETQGVSPPELLGSRAVASAPPAPVAAPIHYARAPVPRPAAAPPSAPTAPAVEVVEVFHGDRVEQRKLGSKGQ